MSKNFRRSPPPLNIFIPPFIFNELSLTSPKTYQGWGVECFTVFSLSHCSDVLNQSVTHRGLQAFNSPSKCWFYFLISGGSAEATSALLQVSTRLSDFSKEIYIIWGWKKEYFVNKGNTYKLKTWCWLSISKFGSIKKCIIILFSCVPRYLHFIAARRGESPC